MLYTSLATTSESNSDPEYLRWVFEKFFSYILPIVSGV